MNSTFLNLAAIIRLIIFRPQPIEIVQLEMIQYCVIQLTYDIELYCTYTWTVLLPCTVARTVDVSCKSVNYTLFRHHSLTFVSSLYHTFDNDLWKGLANLLGSTNEFTTAYSSEENGIVGEKLKHELRINGLLKILWHHSTYCTTIRTILSHLHVLYTVRTIYTAHCAHSTCSLFPCFRCWDFIFNICSHSCSHL